MVALWDADVKAEGTTRVTWDIEAAELVNYSHFMEKEIFEQPVALGGGRLQRQRRDRGARHGR